jgi:hypothetical protein
MQRQRRGGHHVFFNTPCFAPNWVNPLCTGTLGPYYGYPYLNYGYGYGYPLMGGYYYPPIYGMDYSSSESQPAQQQQQPVYVQENPGLQDEVSRLADEVQQLREQQEQPQQAQQRTAAPPPQSPPQPSPPTTLVYRDGRHAEVRNYAIVGHTLWIFNETHAQKIPLAELNLPATRAANEQRGVEFLGPK